MDIEENKEVVLRFNKEFIEQGNVDVLNEVVSEKFTNHTVPSGYPSDVNGLIQFAEILRKEFPDLKVFVHQQTAGSDMVCTHKTIQGTHLGEIMGHPPTGKKVKMTVTDMVRLKNGKYIDHWAENDIIQVIQSL
ncbi:ester cyclase [Galbibacter sp. EGI 63066]|uniref:ester cyclase n=1 Tax=Galbibacter sp. EGI 63066 TaxID=2993559 RepID=UPI00224950D8|nr:ester cyclase [Galbibacter sp. EGI 63066]MCX2680020.1 ester cyclase [Galbibacter sp. EGI 63066]